METKTEKHTFVPSGTENLDEASLLQTLNLQQCWAGELHEQFKVLQAGKAFFFLLSVLSTQPSATSILLHNLTDPVFSEKWKPENKKVP